MVIGHANQIACHGICNAKSACTGLWQIFQREISTDCCFKGFVCGARQDQNMLNA